jgi:hypothetical protein
MGIDLFYPALLLGIIIVIVSLMRHLGQRQRKNIQSRKQQEAALQAAHEAERKNRAGVGLPKAKVALPQTRLPLDDPFGVPFTGAIQGKAAKWEAEIHTLGRQIIGQIDCKMAAMQAITLDANRTANRLEILVEHLEQITRQQIEQQQSQMTQNAEPAAGEPTAVIPATAAVPEAAPLGDILKELDEGIKGVRKTITQSAAFFSEQPDPATVLRLAERQREISADDYAANLRSEVEMLANYGLEPKDIAQRLNISLGEVDLMLQIQQNR